MILAYDEILELLRQGIIENSNPELVNGTSMDVTLGDSILVERSNYFLDLDIIDYAKRTPLATQRVQLDMEHGYELSPGEFILAGSRQVFHMPRTLSADYKLKSSMARIGLQHLNAGWCDAGWNNSVLTMELINVCRYHSIRIRPGDRIGQMVFYRHKEVPKSFSYEGRGRYNNDKQVEGIKL